MTKSINSLLAINQILWSKLEEEYVKKNNENNMFKFKFPTLKIPFRVPLYFNGINRWVKLIKKPVKK